MNRQEAIIVMRDTNWSRMMVDWSYADRRRVLDAIMASLAALRVPETDPDTGLVLCGCGGRAETHELYGHFSGTYMTDCKKCATGTTQYNTKKEAQDAWNTAMGLPEVEG